MPGIDRREERRKKWTPVIAFIITGSLVVSVLFQLFQPGWQWLPLAVGVIAVTAVGVSIDRSGARPRLVVTTWTHEVLRRARLGPRRPG